MTELLANVERLSPPEPSADPPPPGYWLGSAASEVERLRERAVVAETEAMRLRAELEATIGRESPRMQTSAPSAIRENAQSRCIRLGGR